MKPTLYLIRMDLQNLRKAVGTYLLLLFIALCISGLGGIYNILGLSFIFVTYLVIVLPSYLNKNGSEEFLFSLPVTRWAIVLARYWEAALFILFFTGFGTVYYVLGLGRGAFYPTTGSAAFFLFFPLTMYTAFILPLTFIFNIRKLVFLIPIILICLSIFVFGAIFFIHFLQSHPLFSLMAWLLALAATLLFGLSLWLSKKRISRKDI